MMKPSTVQPDIELRNAISGNVNVGLPDGSTAAVAVYGDWERPTNILPDDFISVYVNGDPEGVSMDTPFARGYIMVSLYCKLNSDGTPKKNRIAKIIAQFEDIVEKHATENYYFEYDAQRFITPTTPNMNTGYSVTTLNLRWTTTAKFNSSN